MCGIVAFTGARNATPLLLDGLRRLEYRGYDSAGLAVSESAGISLVKKSGRLENLRKAVMTAEISGTCGISHTRWATHGAPTDENAHPHRDGTGELYLVHNGVIENHAQLREILEREGHHFVSQTDSEILAHWVGRAYMELGGEPTPDRLATAVATALEAIRGTYGIAVMHASLPGTIIGARLGSPLVLGIGRNEHFLASDVSAMVAHTRDVVFLHDRDLVILGQDGFTLRDTRGNTKEATVTRTEVRVEDTERGHFAHHMAKEIHEQAEVFANVLRGRTSLDEATAVLGGLNLTPRELRETGRLMLCACGSAWHAALAGRHIIESLARIPVDVEVASEFRHRNALCPPHTLFFAISQSGETLDTLAAMREALRKGLRALAIVNTVGSTIARESEGGVYLRAGPEVGVAATKSFLAQVTVLTLLGLLLGRMQHLSPAEGREILAELEQVPQKIQQILALEPVIREIAQRHADVDGMLFFGRLAQHPVALEGALKMKEISYIPAEGHPSGELKHGIIALVTPRVPSVFLVPGDAVFDKNMSNMQEIKARGGPVIAISTTDRPEVVTVADDVVLLPPAPPWLMPLLTVIPLQLLAYHVAVARGCDVDKPRNLAKSVTVE